MGRQKHDIGFQKIAKNALEAKRRADVKAARADLKRRRRQTLEVRDG